MDGLLTSSADVYRPTHSQNTMGATVDTPALHLSGLPCRIRAKSGNERAMSGARGVEATHTLYCRVADIVETDEMRIGTTVYDVQFVNDVDAQGHHMEIDLLERRPDRHGR